VFGRQGRRPLPGKRRACRRLAPSTRHGAALPVAAPVGWVVSGTSTTVSGEFYTSEFGPTVGAVAAVSPLALRALLSVLLGTVLLLLVRAFRRRRG
jgi:hypothetical protein